MTDKSDTCERESDRSNSHEMLPTILPSSSAPELLISEGCYIRELSNSAADPELSIAQARVPMGVCTRWHRLVGTTERYLILSGSGMVEVGSLPQQQVVAGDVVLIPAGCRQRIRNTGEEDLVFLALCTPRFQTQAYEDLDSEAVQP